MDKLNIASLLVAIVAALGAWSAQRASARASITNTNTTSRVDMEKEAYDRARAFDTETIRRQDERILELEAEVQTLKSKIARLERDRPITLQDLEGIRDEPRADDGPVPEQPPV